MTLAAPSRVTAVTAPAVVIDLEPWEWKNAIEVGANRTVANWNRKDAPHYDRSRMEDDRTADAASAISELAVAKATGRFWTAGGAWSVSDHHRYRDLPDVGDNIEVRRVRDSSRQDFAVGEKDEGRVIFATYVVPPEFRTVRVLGWIMGAEALEIGTPTAYGRLRVPIAALTLKGIES